MAICHVCHAESVGDILDFSMQPITNRYLARPDQLEATYPLAIGVCRTCGLVQLAQPMPAGELRPRFDWITYNEPERHLDDVADSIVKLPGLNSDSTFIGVSYKDDTTLRRLRERGFGNTRTLDLVDDLHVTAPGAGIESIQAVWNRSTVAELINKYGRPDVLIMRHVFEHSHDIHEVIEALRMFVSPTRYIVLEMPDARRALERLDYSTVWEEHIYYFTPATLRSTLARSGFEVIDIQVHPYTLENSLVAIVRAGDGNAKPDVVTDALQAELARAQTFIGEFPAKQEKYRAYFTRQRQEHGKVALFGAGHLSCALINLLGLADLFEFVIDDHPKKMGMYMPGSRLPIVGSDRLLGHGVKLCCLSVRPEIEDVVIRNNQKFIDQGGTMRSIFPDSRYALGL